MTNATKPWYVRHIWLLAFLSGMLSLTILKACERDKLEALPTYWQLPEFEFTDQDNAPFGSKDLEGKVWIANFIFTSCLTECPMIGQATTRLQEALKGSPIQILSFSVDPEFDSPDRLKAWGERFSANFTQWKLLTGERKAIESLVMEGFKTFMGERQEVDSVVDVAHTMKMVLVDACGFVRYYFDSQDPKSMELLASHAKRLVSDEARRLQDGLACPVPEKPASKL